VRYGTHPLLSRLSGLSGWFHLFRLFRLSGLSGWFRLFRLSGLSGWFRLHVFEVQCSMFKVICSRFGVGTGTRNEFIGLLSPRGNILRISQDEFIYYLIYCVLERFHFIRLIYKGRNRNFSMSTTIK